MSKDNKIEDIQFDWIQLQHDIGMVHETNKERMFRKVKENPFIPIGCLATAGALTYGLWCFRNGERKMSQYMMRTRVVAQGFTVFALIAGIGISAFKGKE